MIFFLYHEIIGKSNFYCPLIKFNLFIQDRTTINSPFFPYYEPCSLDCNSTILYIHNVLEYPKFKDLIDEDFFYFLKSPILIFKDYIFSFNGYYDNGIIYYRGVYIRNISLSGKIVYKKKLNVFEVNGNKCIIGGVQKKNIMKRIMLRYLA